MAEEEKDDEDVARESMAKMDAKAMEVDAEDVVHLSLWTQG